MALADFANFKAPLPYIDADSASDAFFPIEHNSELAIPSDHLMQVYSYSHK